MSFAAASLKSSCGAPRAARLRAGTLTEAGDRELRRIKTPSATPPRSVRQAPAVSG
jgi:hypothetical protein